MIKYNLKCDNNHEFESWFADSNEFEKLKNKKLLDCIYCSSKKIKKSIMSPRLSGINNDNNEESNKLLKSEKQRLIRLRKYIENNFENVGENFSKKVREIYYDKDSKKTIYGTTTPEEREELSQRELIYYAFHG